MWDMVCAIMEQNLPVGNHLAESPMRPLLVLHLPISVEAVQKTITKKSCWFFLPTTDTHGKYASLDLQQG